MSSFLKIDSISTDSISEPDSQNLPEELTTPTNPNSKTVQLPFNFSLLERVPVPMIYFDCNYQYTFVNGAYASWFQKKPNEIVGKTISQFLGDEAFEALLPFLMKAKGGETTKVELAIPAANGLRYVDATITPEFEGDVVKGMFAVINNVTEKVLTEKKLNRKQFELQDYLDNAAVGLHWLDAEGIIIWANKAELDMLGYSESEYIGRHISEFHNNKEVIADILSRLMRNDKLEEYEAEVVRKDGSTRVVSINSSVLWDDGKFVHTRCFTTDITDRKRTLDLLKQSENKYREIFRQAEVGLAIYVGADFRVEFINDFSLAIAGLERAEILNKPIFDLFPEIVEQGYKDVLTKVFTTGEKYDARGEHIYFYRKGELTEGWFNTLVEPFRNLDGNIEGVMVMSTDITSETRSRIKIEENEKNHRRLLDALPHAVYSCDKEGRITYHNDVAAKLWGCLPNEEFKYCVFKQIWTIDGEKIDAEKSPMAEAAQNGKTFKDVEVKFERGDGSTLYALVNISPVLDNEGNPNGAVNIFQDISDRKKSEEFLRASEERYRNLVKGLPAAIYTTDKDGVLSLYNQAAVDLWGWKPEIGKDKWCGSWRIFESDGLVEVPLDECPMAIALKEKRRVEPTEEFIVERPDGSRRFFVPYPHPTFDYDGNLTGAVNMLIDVTDRKAAEVEQAMLAAIVKSSEDAIISIDLSGIITSWNPAAEKMYGYKAAEILGESINIVIPINKREEHEDIINRIKNGAQIDTYETTRLSKNGDLLELSLSISCIKDSHDKIIGLSKIARDISDEKQLREAVIENEERLKMAIESAKLGTWEYFPGTKNIVCSAECKAILGIPEDMEPDNQFAVDYTHPDDREMKKEEIRKVIDPAGTGTCRFQYRIIRYNDNEVRWIKVQGRTFFDGKNNPQSIIGTILDITDEKRHEQQLQESVELFQTMADNVPAMIWMSGNDKFNDYFNRAWLDFTGRSLEQEGMDGWLESVHPDDVTRCIETYNNSFNRKEGFNTEYRLKHHDGKYRWISDHSVPRYSVEGEFQGFISACIDIDDQKLYREKILDSELLFKTISNASPAALWMTDADGRNVFVNNTWIKWTGRSFEEQMLNGWHQSIEPEDRGRALEKFVQCSAERRYYGSEFRFKKHTGEIRWGLTEGYPFYDINKNFAGYAGSVTDITELKKLEQRKDDFIKMASHELKTPITSISGYVQLLLNLYTELDDEKLMLSKSTIRGSLSTISRQVAKLTRLISELLDLSKIESGQLELNKTEFEFSDLVEETVQDMRHTTSRHTIKLNNNFNGVLYADKDRIGQAIVNLLANAIKYSPEGEKILVSVWGDKKMISIQVQDFGIGINKKDHDKIFDRFYRAEGKSEQTFPGFGIGLFIASEILHRHNGSISVESEKDKGSTFTIKIPINQK